MKKLILPILIVFISSPAIGQDFTRQDTLRGSITPERAWWNLTYYDLAVEVHPDTKYIEGHNRITYTVLEAQNVMQLELQEPMKIDKIIQNERELEFYSDGYSHFIQLKEKQKPGKTYHVIIYFSGKPKKAVRPPWDGGFTWTKDSDGTDFIATSNQGIGASIWWPNKDHSYDEPDNGMRLSIKAPGNLIGVGNGRLVETKSEGNLKKWVWEVKNPINNYGVNINLANYVHFGEKYKGRKGELDLDYWVLKENFERAKAHFVEVPKTIEALEYWFGPYPFYEDSFKLVEVPYLGMEHQSSVTYGNNYELGFSGKDMSNTGWGLRFDYIIVHESAHEWFANNITNVDVADMWIQEGFTTYAESLYLDYHFGKQAASEYVIGTRRFIQNDRPMIGSYNVNNQGSGDIYFKSANILHMLRQLIEDDELWRSTLIGLNSAFYHQTVTSKQIEEFISDALDKDLSAFWNQYLRTTKIPKFRYKVNGNTLEFRYEEIVDKFDMPLIALINGKEVWVFPTVDWKTETFDEKIESVAIKADFYVDSESIEK